MHWFGAMDTTPTTRPSAAPSGRKKRLVRVYIPTPLLEELLAEAARLDRPISWLLQKAWTISRERLKEMREPEIPAVPAHTTPVGATHVA